MKKYIFLFVTLICFFTLQSKAQNYHEKERARNMETSPVISTNGVGETHNTPETVPVSTKMAELLSVEEQNKLTPEQARQIWAPNSSVAVISKKDFEALSLEQQELKRKYSKGELVIIEISPYQYYKKRFQTSKTAK